MTDHPTLEPITYEPVYDDKGKRVGWKVPKHEQKTWEALREQRENRTGIYATTNPAPRTATAAKPITQLIAELETWLYLDQQLEQQLRNAYNNNPDKTTRLVDHITRGCEQRKLNSPAGALAKRLRTLEPASLIPEPAERNA